MPTAVKYEKEKLTLPLFLHYQSPCAFFYIKTIIQCWYSLSPEPNIILTIAHMEN